ncbi:MAG: lysostaphin resistance A-like protein, partial [Alphaproteobacteria bacterium]
PEAGPPRIPFVAVIAAVAGALILIVGGAIALRLVLPDANIIGLLVVEAAGLIFAVYAAVVRLPGIGWSGVGLRPAPAIWTWLAIPIAFGAMIVAAALTYAVLYAIGEIDTNPQLKALAPAAFGGLWAKLGLIAMAGLVVPFAEELLFRGVLYTWLRQHLGFIAVAVITSALFAVAHLLPSRVIGFFVVGMFAAYLREKSNSIWPSVVLHASFNSLNLAILLFLAPLLKDQLAG